MFTHTIASSLLRAINSLRLKDMLWEMFHSRKIHKTKDGARYLRTYAQVITRCQKEAQLTSD